MVPILLCAASWFWVVPIRICFDGKSLKDVDDDDYFYVLCFFDCLTVI